MKLEPLTRDDAEQVRVWRNEPEMQAVLRTAKRLTYDEQQAWYTNEIANRESHTRYWALTEHKPARIGSPHYFEPTPAVWDNYRQLLGYGGIEHISWENSNGEISLLLDPSKYKQGLGSEAVALFLDQAFNYLNLRAVFAECYESGPVGFWEQAHKRYSSIRSFLPMRKYYKGRNYGSYVFTFYKERFDEKHMRDTSKGKEQATTGEEYKAILRQGSC